MKLSIETKVAAAVAAAFAALTVGVIAQGNNGEESAGSSRYQPANQTSVIQRGYHGSLPAPLTTEEGETYRFAAEDGSAQTFISDTIWTGYDRRNARITTEE